ncbi:50S ribosomal protein L24 [Enemella sp. A6]|uniref:50S ribosomal protein L24 n=1 Tax=Enemella sp. A6 TaxID=3440152 RepID=UPI003EBC7C38
MARKKLHVVKGDQVKVIAGKDKGRTGEVLSVDIERERVTVSNVNIVQRHRRDSQGADGRTTKGGIISSEAPIHVSNVQLVVKDEDGNEVVTRVGYTRTEVTKKRADGSEYKGFRSVRIARKTGEELNTDDARKH